MGVALGSKKSVLVPSLKGCKHAHKDGQGSTLAYELPEEGTSKLKHQAEAPELQKGPSTAAMSI